MLVVAVVHYLNGAIRLQPMGERVTPNAKAHLSVLLALAALVKAADYWLQRYELTFSTGAGLRRRRLHRRQRPRSRPSSS